MSTTGKVGPDNLSAGDRISLSFADTPDQQITATIRRKVSDRQEGLAPEIDQYVDYWREISCAGDDAETKRRDRRTVTSRSANSNPRRPGCPSQGPHYSAESTGSMAGGGGMKAQQGLQMQGKRRFGR